MQYNDVPSGRQRPPVWPPPSCFRLIAAARPELLARCRDGCTEAPMIAHGFTTEQLVALVRAKLATATPERVVAGGAQASRSLGRGLRMKGGK
jgi:hypothetical protein